MLLAPHPDGHVAVGQPAHAWLSGQLARAWGNDRFGAVEPCEEVCLAAEQHDVGMGEWDLHPTLDRDTGLPSTFLKMDVETHMRLWTEGPARLLAQSRYAALLASMHASALYAGRAGDPRVDAFLAQRLAFEQGLRATLDQPDDAIARNRRLVGTWDGLSLALILGWAPWRGEDVPAARGEPVALALERAQDGPPAAWEPAGARHALDPWPFGAETVTVRTEGRLLTGRFEDEGTLHRALDSAPWVQLRYVLVSAAPRPS